MTKIYENKHKKMIQNINYNFKETNFLVIWISGIWRNKILTNNIVDFNPDKIIIPKDCSEHIFILKAAIIYKPLGAFKGVHSNNGHYTCWTRQKNGWLKISDNICYFHKKFEDYMKNVYVLLLEKMVEEKM